MKLGDTSAFPIPNANDFNESHSGMTLRQYYAGLAMQGYIAGQVPGKHEDVARWSVERADALLAALEK